jgi:hypothetical protein
MQEICKAEIHLKLVCSVMDAQAASWSTDKHACQNLTSGAVDFSGR